MSKNEKGIVHILLLILLLAGIALGVYLVQQKTNIFSKAAILKPAGPETSFSLVGQDECSGLFCALRLQKGIQVEEEFKIEVFVRSDIDEVNLFKAKITFPKDLIEVININTDLSFITNWVEQNYDNNEGAISLVGGVTAPGYKTEQNKDSALMVTITFRTKNTGKGTLSFTDDSQVYRNTDNQNILTVKRLLDLTIEKKPSTPTPTVTLEDYWNGKAQWKFTHKLTIDNTHWAWGYGAGAHIEVVNNTWYLFSRKYYTSVAKCGVERLGTIIRKSTDEGKTWSNEVEILTPVDGTPWECAATDGDAYYEADKQKWHYLFQCLASSGGWKTCHAERNSSDPMGSFSQTKPNPVLLGKDLWSKICNENSDDCVKIAGGVNKVFDEGTIDIFKYDGKYFYVSFHGYDGRRGYRGIAKTADFINWIAGDESQGVPKDAIFDANDQKSWREAWDQNDPTGGGAARIIAENDYYYMLIEGSDVGLGCADGQNWDWGLFRSQSLTSTSWKQFPLGNPILYSSKFPERNGKSPACTPAYAGIFKDPSTNKYHMHFTRGSIEVTKGITDPGYDGIYFYELVPSRNLLKNADFWMCSYDYWNRLPADGSSTNRAVYRYPNNSSDGNCYLATNCGKSSCDAVQSMYQDVDMANISSRQVEYGGKFATDEGEGQIELVLHELDEKGAVIASYRSNENINSTYKLIQKEVILTGKAKKLRLETYLRSPQTFRLDEMFVNTNSIGFSTSSPSPSPTPTPTPIPTSTPLLPKKGDGNKDGTINLVDMSVLLTDFNKETGFREPIDMNDDKKINTFDFSLHRKLLVETGVIKGQ